ncbi:hypothetical protein EDC01DRAFT_595592, partial [Geopyxis carbonaria]
MCNYQNTVYKACGCKVEEQTELCGYHDDDFSECMNSTKIVELKNDGQCGRNSCK